MQQSHLSMTYSNGWTPQDLTYDDRNCFLLRFLAPNPTKELQASRHTHNILLA
jgi:hypothetical protein